MAIGNTTTRIIVSVVAIPAILLVSYLGSYYFFAFCLLIGTISYYEFRQFVKKKNINLNLLPGLIAVILIMTNAFDYFIDFYALTILLITAITLIELFRNNGSPIINIGATLLGIFYIGLFSSALVYLREYYPVGYEKGGFIIISVLVSIWICDSAAFFGGTALGKHKLFLRVSPQKTWEGAVFGLLFAIISMIISKLVILDFLSWRDIIMIGLIVGVIGQIGDLIESLFKRDTGVKDSSSIIPGHGGVFDRFDSLLYTGPIVLLYLKYLV